MYKKSFNAPCDGRQGVVLGVAEQGGEVGRHEGERQGLHAPIIREARDEAGAVTKREKAPALSPLDPDPSQ